MHTSVNDVLNDEASGDMVPAARFAIMTVLLFGLLVPTVATLAGSLLFPSQANGSLLLRDGTAVGSSLVAQQFVGDGYFHARPSAADYDPRAMAGSNLAASNPALRERMLIGASGIAARENVPVSAIAIDMITASGSGIDPHVSAEAAKIQLARVAQARGLSVPQVQALVDANTHEASFGVLGQDRVNVLELNLALDAITP